MARYDVVLVGSPVKLTNTTIAADTVSRQGRSPDPLVSIGSRVLPAALARLAAVGAVTIGSTDRSGLVAGTYVPGATTTGVLPGVARSNYTGNITLNTANQVVQNLNINGRVSLAANSTKLINCLVLGENTDTPLVSGTSKNNVTSQVIDCTMAPQYQRANQNCFEGHDATLLRCDMSKTGDIVQVKNGEYGISLTDGWACRVTVQQCWLHEPGWYTAATGGVVHTSDTETHNDMIQLFGGSGFKAIGNHIDARYARQYGHWWVTDPNTEPYVTVALHSLPSGGPYQNIPERGVSDLSPLRTSGNDLNGRYNWDDIAGLMISATQGPTSQITFTDNYCRGGNYFVNGGGNHYPGTGIVLGDFLRNTFFEDQGDFQTTIGAHQGNTINLDGTSWNGRVNIPLSGADGNYYTTGQPIVVR